jgi:transposase
MVLDNSLKRKRKKRKRKKRKRKKRKRKKRKRKRKVLVVDRISYYFHCLLSSTIFSFFYYI